jgi:predicted DNA binding CopG/RHH family protein
MKIDADEKALLEPVERGEWKGLPYQTLISSLLHKYASGRLKKV